MLAFVALRLIRAVVTILAVLVVVFFLLYATGDPTNQMTSIYTPTETIAQMRHELGFDLPVHIQFARFIVEALHGRFGSSFYWRNQDALHLVTERIPATIQLAGAALAFSVPISMVLGIVAGYKRGKKADQIVQVASLLGQAMPVFWLGIMLILVFSVKLHLLPTSGRGNGVLSLILPAISLGAFFTARSTRLVRSAMLDTLGKDYIRTARAKGVREAVVLTRHALRNASIPIVTMLGLDIGALLGGAIVTEQVFAWPGMGRLAVQAVLSKDVPVVEAVVLFSAAAIVLVNALMDVAYALLDPRIRYV